MKKIVSAFAMLLMLFLAVVWFTPARRVLWPGGQSPETAAQNRQSPAETEEGGKRPNDWFYVQRSYPQKTLDLQAWKMARQQADLFRQQLASEVLYWQPVGPSNIGGRITAIAANPAQPNKLWIGSADGGVWKSGNGGGEWSPVFEFAPSLSIGAIAVAPDDPQTVYVGTGEANSSGDSYPGTGIYKTNDGGVSWSYLGLPESYHIGRIAVNPRKPDTIFVAVSGKLFGKNTERGIYRTRNGGITWERVLFVSDSTAAIDVVINPQHPDTVYAAMWERIRRPWQRQAGGITSGIYRSADGGSSWTLLSNGLPPASQTVGRIGLAIAPSNPAVLYAIYANHPGYFSGIFKTSNSGQSWTRVNDGALSGLYSSFGWYFGQIVVDPANENIVYALGVSLYKSNNGGNSWTQIGWNVHVDHHALWIDPNNTDRLFLGNDGGMFISQNGGASFQKVYHLPLTQFYTAAVDANSPTAFYGGTQDNGTLRTLSGYLADWEEIYGGDGFYVIVDPANSNIIYAEYQWGGLGKSTDGGNSFYPATNGINGNDRTNWMVPVVMDPNNSQVLYYGTYRVYRTVNGAASWSPISPDLSNGPYSGGLSFGTVTTIAVSPVNPQLVYAGTDDGNIWVTQNSVTNWVKRSSGLPNRWVTRVAAHPTQQNTALACYSGYKHNEYLGYIFKTTDSGQSWTDITHNLPQAPINAVIIDPDSPDIYYLATDVGVFYSVDAGDNWQMLGQNLPNSAVMDLAFHRASRTLVAATHGRSMFKIDVSGISGIAEAERPLTADSYYLTPNFPNPFNQETVIGYYLPKRTRVSLIVYDLLGRPVARIFHGEAGSGWQQIRWNGRNDAGEEVSSGSYFYRLITPEGSISRRLTVVR